MLPNVMHHSDLGDREPKLAIYGHQVRREAGEAKADAPATVGTATYDAAAKALKVAA